MALKKLHRSACLTNYEEVAKALHISPLEQLRRVNINSACLTNPDIKIPVSAFIQLMENSAQAAGVENFGLRMAEGRKLSNLGPLAVVLRSQSTMRKALEALRNYSHLQAEAVSFLFEENDGILIIREELMPDRPEPIRQATELSLGVLYRALHVLLGDEWRPSAVCFRHPPPNDMSVHRRVFDSRLQFNSNIDGIICRASNLDDPLPNYDPETARYLQKLLDVINTQPTHSVTDKVRELVWVLLPTGRCSTEIVSRHIGLNRRTLHRHLQKNGQSFSDILDSIRSDMAIKYLVQYHRPIKELAELLGFSEPSAFSRWFTHRFGCTAKSWRQNQKSDNVPSR
ncbi:Transcriptional regulator, AraC family [Georgfuchsia toluolica]|uniref:Transcriptional regulator, AraC family n=1 Tax=Georgfuchsia toluolica TaxID=424218 RepID=A0A916J2V6_9PROT|nr:AraC family transcriptional regulator [Georgfuchsia toluolica]CAG4883699.1 Transcriptional regulator, AraC family [Georgfuchsia toluolica]